MAVNPAGDDNLAGNPFIDSDGDVHANDTTIYLEDADIVTSATEGLTIKGVKVSATIAVAVPTIADAKNDVVLVDVAAMAFAPAVGDIVFAVPLVALPTDCLLLSAYVSATDTVSVTFGTKEGGAGVTGANKDFKFIFWDLT